MKHTTIAATLCTVLASAPAMAQEGDGVEEGLDLLGRGAEALMRGLMDELRPQLEQLAPELRRLGEGIGPMLSDLTEMIDELDAYHPPERLPNGDIILRRKESAPPAPRELPPPEEGEIDI
jgi:hypothetical protein